MSGSYKEEGLRIRNKLLLFRFRNLNKRKPTEKLVDRSIEPRLNQIFVPLLSIIEDPGAVNDLRELARRYNREMIADRHGSDYEKKITSKWIGSVIRKKLNLKTQKTRDGYIIPSSELTKLERLYEKYGVTGKEDNEVIP